MRAVPLILAFVFSFGVANAAQTSSGASHGGQNFSCNVATGECVCAGPRDSPDCKAAYKNCNLRKWGSACEGDYSKCRCWMFKGTIDKKRPTFNQGDSKLKSN